VWDSSDAFTGSVFIRATARDDEMGVAADGAAPKEVRGRLEVEPFVLGGSATTDFPVSVAAADLDGDGDQDLVSANHEGNNLAVFFQHAPGSFEASPLTLGDSATTFGPRSVAAADLDGDGDQDLVSANLGGDLFPSSSLTIFFQLAPGSFATTPLTLDETGLHSSVVAADLDGDGDQDLVSANEFGDNLTVFFQLAPGTFAATPLTFGGLNGSVVAADLDGDGDQDLVSTSLEEELTIFFQLAPGRFADSPLTLGGSATTNGPVSVAVADLDGDGDQDLVSANELGNNLTVFFQLSPGSFGATPLTLGGSGTTNGPGSVAATDLDGDGDRDLVSANQIGNNLTVFFQLSPGSFEAIPLKLGGFPTTNRPSSVAAADVDGDGDPDLVSANLHGDNLTVFLQLSSESFGAASLTLGGFPTTNSPGSVAAADLDGDGDQDLVSANRGDSFHPESNLTVFFQPSPGSYAATPLTLGGSETTNRPFSVAAADLDGDGDQDFVSANAGGESGINSSLTVFFQPSPGSFGATPLTLGGSATTNQPHSVVAADLDGDGDQDLVSANANGSDLTVYFQLSPGNFAAAPLALGGLGTTDWPVSVVAADLDGDGNQDLVSANRNGNNLTVFFQLSPGSFGAAPHTLGGFPTTESPVSVAAADLDGDGDQDLVSANLFGDNLTVFLQLSPRSFAASPLTLGGSASTNGPVSVAVADIDGDGDQDLVSANSHGFDLTVFFGGR
jgi:hypothetical protein